MSSSDVFKYNFDSMISVMDQAQKMLNPQKHVTFSDPLERVNIGCTESPSDFAQNLNLQETIESETEEGFPEFPSSLLYEELPEHMIEFAENGLEENKIDLLRKRQIKIENYVIQNRPGVYYFDNRMRTSCFQWLKEVCEDLNRRCDYEWIAIWFKAIQLFDMFMCKKQVPRGQFQLTVTACALIASKMIGEQYLLSELCYCSDDSFTEKQLKTKEIQVLKELNYNLSYSTLFDFVAEQDVEYINEILEELMDFTMKQVDEMLPSERWEEYKKTHNT